MSGGRAAIRYAKATLQQADEANAGDLVFDDMRSVQATIRGSKELRAMLKSPVIKAEDKRQALLSIFDDESKYTHNLINVVVDNKRTDILAGIAESYISLYNEAKGIKEANVTTAVALTSELENQVLEKVKEITGSSNVTLKSDVDASIIGGFILRVGDLQYDTSIANKLENIKREFSKSL